MSITSCPMCQSPIQLELPEAAKTCSHCGADLGRWMPKPAAPPSLPLSPPPPDSSFPQQAAICSLVAPLISFVIGIFVQPQVRGNHIAMIVLGLSSTLLIIAGLILGIVALVVTKRHGREGIFRKALTGTCINGLLVLMMVIGIAGLLTARERARARPSQTGVQQSNESSPELQDKEEREAIIQARATVQTFIDALTAPSHRGLSFEVRKDFQTVGGPEHFWLREVSFDGKLFHGTVSDTPAVATQVKLGDRIAVSPNEISDWWFIDADRKKMIGGYTLRADKKRWTPERRKAWEKSVGIDSSETERK
jgi:uncharacterized protein YegJ (DUF2314 family)